MSRFLYQWRCLYETSLRRRVTYDSVTGIVDAGAGITDPGYKGKL